MTDHPFPAAANFDRFELRLANELRDLSAPAVEMVDAKSLVTDLAAPYPAARRSAPWVPLLERRRPLAFALLLVGTALIGSMLLFGGNRASVPPGPLPSSSPLRTPTPASSESPTSSPAPS